MNMPTILFVEDDENIRNGYAELLKRAGFEVSAFADGETALVHFDPIQTELVILDISLGDDTEAGFHLCAELRRRSETVPIIFLTCHDSDFDKISGMRLGADDYLTKDVNVDYLVVRIKALLHRIAILNKRIKEKPENKIQRGDLMLNMDTLNCTWKGQPLDLNLTQLWMLHDLVSNRNQVRNAEQIMNAANMTIQPSTVAGHIMNIRKLFQTVDPDFTAIRTERGFGYRWVEGQG